jgi:hypothetical protein
MGIVVKDTGGGDDFELAPQGTQIARCWRIVDIGTRVSKHLDERTGKPKQARKIIISWELVGTDMGNGKPFIVSERYTASLHKKSTLRKVLEGWRGSSFTPEQLEGFALKQLLGKPALLGIVHSEDGKYANVKTAAGLPKGMTAPSMVNAPYELSLDDFDRSVFEGLSEGMKRLISEAPEFAALQGQPQQPATVGDMDDDIPF